MPYRIAGIDVHKKMLAVVVADVEIDGDFHFERQKVGTTPADLRGLADWLVEHEVEEVVMESTAQYWRPVWEALEQHWRPRRRTRDGAPRLTFGNIALYRSSLFRDLPRGEKAKILPLYQDWIGRGWASGELFTGRWANVGTRDDLSSLETLLRAQPRTPG